MSDEITIEDVRSWVKQLEDAAIAPRDFHITIQAGDYPTMSDEHFISMCNHKKATFYGSIDACNRMRERMKQLGIK